MKSVVRIVFRQEHIPRKNAKLWWTERLEHAKNTKSDFKANFVAHVNNIDFNSLFCWKEGN